MIKGVEEMGKGEIEYLGVDVKLEVYITCKSDITSTSKVDNFVVKTNENECPICFGKLEREYGIVIHLPSKLTEKGILIPCCRKCFYNFISKLSEYLKGE